MDNTAKIIAVVGKGGVGKTSISAMRDKVSNYMQTVMQEQPVDASLVDFEDDVTW